MRIEILKHISELFPFFYNGKRSQLDSTAPIYSIPFHSVPISLTFSNSIRSDFESNSETQATRAPRSDQSR